MRNGAERPKPARRRGASAVEFALVLPLLVTVVLGCVDFGRFAYTYIGVTNAAREGAYFAAKNPWTSTTDAAWRAQLRLAVENELGCHDPGSSFDPASVSVSCPTDNLLPKKNKNDPDIYTPVLTDSGDKRIGVLVSYPFAMVVNWPFIPNQVTVGRTVQMRALY